MVAFKNFYETLNEARMRLRGTYVQYKDDFYYVHEVTDHMEDGIFRVYMDKLGQNYVGPELHGGEMPDAGNNFTGAGIGKMLDAWMDTSDAMGRGFIRKFANSKHFNRFRPFPLGNVNTNKGNVVHTVRTPTRNMHQGLLREAIVSTLVQSTPPVEASRRFGSLRSSSTGFGGADVHTFGPEFYAMLKNEYPSYEEVVTNLRDPEILNDGCAFHREWSVLRGPVDLLFLCFEDSGVGVIYENGEIQLGKDFEYLKETVEDLNITPKLTVKGVS